MPYKDKEKQKKYQLDRAKRLRLEWLDDNGPCVKCGSWNDLEVDHIKPETKAGHRIWSWSLGRRTEELKKCQVLCRSCHIMKTVSEQSVETPHGTHTGYSYHGCRCEGCKRAHRKYWARWKREHAA